MHHQIIAWQHLGLKVHLIPTNEGFPREPLFEEMIRRGVKVHLPHDFRVLEPEDAILGFCNAEFLAKLPEIIQRTRRTVFLNCMTWLFDKEKECMARGEIGMFLYQNENVRQKHMPELRALRPNSTSIAKSSSSPVTQRIRGKWPRSMSARQAPRSVATIGECGRSTI